jgi:hypothetical protein
LRLPSGFMKKQGLIDIVGMWRLVSGRGSLRLEISIGTEIVVERSFLPVLVRSKDCTRSEWGRCVVRSAVNKGHG